MRKHPILLLIAVLFATQLVWGQQPAPETGQQSSPASEPAKPEGTPTAKKSKSLPPFLIMGTVFNENALSFPNVRVQIRRLNEKKFRWEIYTNSRGEFAQRVPEGQEYEVVVKEKKYKDASVKVKANSGDVQDRLSIRLELVNPENGAKP